MKAARKAFGLGRHSRALMGIAVVGLVVGVLVGQRLAAHRAADRIFGSQAAPGEGPLVRGEEVSLQSAELEMPYKIYRPNSALASDSSITTVGWTTWTATRQRITSRFSTHPEYCSSSNKRSIPTLTGVIRPSPRSSDPLCLFEVLKEDRQGGLLSW